MNRAMYSSRGTLIVLGILFAMRYVDACASWEFGCNTGNQCIPTKWRCDGVNDCYDRGDEENCVAEYCKSNPCRNGTTCFEMLSGYRCYCAEGYRRADCLANDCASRPCKNGGSCYWSISGYQCLCPDGYTGLQCQAECGVDVIFLLDHSGSINFADRGNWNRVKNFTVATVLKLNIATSKTRVGLIKYGDDAKNIFYLNTYSDEINLVRAIREVKYDDGGTNIVAALTLAQKIQFSEEHGDRPKAPNVVILLTDGRSTVNKTQTIPTAEKLHSENIFVFSIGVQSDELNEDELCGISSPPHRKGHTCFVRPFTGLDAIASSIARRACHAAAICESSPCVNGGTCYETLGGYRCFCVDRYTGTACENVINHCEDKPCKNGGTCIGFQDTYRCTCPTGYLGRRCQTAMSYCQNNPCRHGGTCLRNGGGYRCRCSLGYTGSLCETEYCGSRPCYNGGSCYASQVGRICHCVAGYTGSHCEIVVGGCHTQPCENGGQCYWSGFSPECRCPSGYTGVLCETALDVCESGPCRNGGSCYSSRLGYTCNCVTGYKGSHCETTLDYCASRPCKNGGRCYVSGSEYKCDCVAGYRGTHCELVEDCNTRSCENGGMCYWSGSNYECLCASGYKGFLCQISDCDSGPCGNGGSCQTSSSGYQCDCPNGYTGTQCQIECGVDLVFVMGHSSNFADNMNLSRVINFMIDIVSKLDISQSRTRVGLIKYGTYAENIFYLKTYSDRTELIQAIKRVTYAYGSANIVAALNLTLLQFTEENGDRQMAPDIVIVLTDGQFATNPTPAIQTAAHLNSLKIFLFAIGIQSGALDVDKVCAISSPPYRRGQTCFFAPFAGLDALAETIASRTCHVAVECVEQLDIGFVLTTSDSMSPANYRKVMDFLLSVINRMRIGPNHVQVGLVLVRNSARIQFNLNSYTTAEDIFRALAVIQQRWESQTGNNIAHGLELLQTKIFSHEWGDRKGAANIGILITDSQSDISVSNTEGRAAEARNAGIRLFAVGIERGFSVSELHGITNNPRNVLTIQGFDSLKDMTASLLQLTCGT